MMKGLHILAYVLVIVGALNWGLIGVFNLNLVNVILGTIPWLERLIYVLVGLSAVYDAFLHAQNCKMCGK